MAIAIAVVRALILTLACVSTILAAVDQDWPRAAFWAVVIIVAQLSLLTDWVREIAKRGAA